MASGEAAGEYLAMAVLYSLVEGDAPRVAGLALLAVLIFSFLDLRKPVLAMGAVAALVTGMCWAGAGSQSNERVSAIKPGLFLFLHVGYFWCRSAE